ncbi:MAG: hypothetical protein VX346_14590 [Planctomycetota bacterium]|nr:hypothetical protein [Planctomycetota bacterium]
MTRRCSNWAVFALWLIAVQVCSGFTSRDDGQRVLIVSHDQQALFVPAFVIAEEQQLDGPQLERLIRETVDVHVSAKVDIISLCFFARYSTGMPHSRTAQTWNPTPDLFPRPANDHLYHALEKLGDRDRMQIVVDQCHRRGIRCIANLRMNDRHRVTDYVKELYRRHPEWRLKSPVGAFSERQGALNFKYDGVREHLLAFTAELLERYDVDGLELDYMRMCHLFEPAEARQHAHLLTEMMRLLRGQLSLAARRRKRGSLVLGVRVPSSLTECDILGYEVKTWIHEGLVDFVTPADFWSTDFVARTEEFADLAKQASCKVYPSLSPTSSFPGETGYLNSAQYRAAANNFYAFGADGLSAYNFSWTWAYQHGNVVAGLGTVWPTRSLDLLTELKDPVACRMGPRQYLAYPLWQNQSPTGVARSDKIVLTSHREKRISMLRLRAAEQPRTSHEEISLQMLVTGLGSQDHLRLSFNNHTIPESRLKKMELQGPGLQRVTFAVDPAFLRFGDNSISAAMETTRQTFHVEIDRFALTFRPRP